MCSLMAFAPSSSGFCACAAHEPLPTRATKAVVKKSGKIAEAPPSAAAGWIPSIFLDFEGARTPAVGGGKCHHGVVTASSRAWLLLGEAKCRCHSALLFDADPELLGRRPPEQSHLSAKVFDDFQSVVLLDPEVASHRQGQIQVERVVGLRDIELQPIGVGHWIHVVGGGELPALARDKDETMVAQVVIRVADH